MKRDWLYPLICVMVIWNACDVIYSATEDYYVREELYGNAKADLLATELELNQRCGATTIHILFDPLVNCLPRSLDPKSFDDGVMLQDYDPFRDKGQDVYKT